MEKDIRERIALKRYQIISPVLAEPKRAQNDYFRKQAQIEHDFPRYGLKTFSVSTLKSWLKKYRTHGFEGLKPKNRSDGGRPRRLDPKTLKAIEIKCKAYPYLTVQKLYENLRRQDLLGNPPVHYNTLLRIIKDNRWLNVNKRCDVRKAYEVDNVNDLWVCDFMHGNQAFWLWLQDDYHHKLHAGIGERPIDRYNASVETVPIRRLNKSELDEIFLIRHERVVNNDATISFKGCLYEVPPAYIRHKIEVRHPVDDPKTLFLYDNDIRVGKIKLLDKKENARTFKPKTVTTTLSFHNGRVES